MSTDAAEISKRIRAHTGWSQAALAERLLVSRNYISLVEGEKNQASMRLLRSLQRLAEDVGLMSKLDTHSVSITREGVAQEGIASHSTASSLREEARRDFEAVIRAAGDDVGRVGWLREQVRLHLTAPSSWSDLHGEIAADVALERRAYFRNPPQSPPNEQGAAGKS